MVQGLFRRGLLAVAFLPVAFAWGDDWPEWRGPRRDGHSLETGLPAKWSPSGENLAWKAPFGARATPVIFGNRLYVLHPSVDPVKERAKTEELLSCLDADTGKVLWQHAIRVFHSDVPTHRVAWASPSVDPATGNVYVFGVHDELSGFTGDGKPLWSRSITEEFGAISTHGGRTVSPVIVGDLVIVSTLTAGWGDQARGNNRWFAFDKLTGQTVWVSNPQPRHYDTNYSTPAVFDVDGATLLVVGGSDGAMHAIKAATGEAVWAYEMSKRAILTSPAVSGTTVYVSHSEENLDSSEMGIVAAIDGTSKGTLKLDQAKWRTIGFQGGFASPVIDGDRLYQADNGAVLGAFDLATGKKVWERPMGTLQKASPVFADGKLYLATENGKLFILKPGPTGVEILDEDVLGPADNPEIIVASPAIARGRIYLASMDHLYAIGPKKAARTAPRRAASAAAPAAAGEPTFVQVRPCESLIKPGEKVTFTVKLYDAKGRFVRDEPGAAWAVEGLKGEAAAGVFTAAADTRNQAGTVVATVGALKGTARVRVAPPLPWSYDFENLTTEAPPPFWVNSTGKYAARDKGDPGHREADRAPAHEARSGLHGSARHARLHGRGRRPRHREAAANGRRGRHRAAVRPHPVRERPEDRAASLAGQSRAHCRGAVRLEGRYLVQGQAEGLEHRRRNEPGPGQGLAFGRPRTRGVEHRLQGHHAPSPGLPRPLCRRPRRSLLRQREGERQ